MLCNCSFSYILSYTGNILNISRNMGLDYIRGFSTWWSYKQFKKQYRYLNEECPHCGGTGLKDDDEGAKMALERLKSFCRAPERRIIKHIVKLKAKSK